jgi:hypothetical protein
MTAPDLPTEARAYSYDRVADVRLWTVVLPELAREVEQLRRERAGYAALCDTWKCHAEVFREQADAYRARCAELERERDDARAEAAVLRAERNGRETP